MNNQILEGFNLYRNSEIKVVQLKNELITELKGVYVATFAVTNTPESTLYIYMIVDF